MWYIEKNLKDRLWEARVVCWSHAPEGWGQNRKYPKVEIARNTPILEHLWHG